MRARKALCVAAPVVCLCCLNEAFAFTAAKLQRGQTATGPTAYGFGEEAGGHSLGPTGSACHWAAVRNDAMAIRKRAARQEAPALHQLADASFLTAAQRRAPLLLHRERENSLCTSCILDGRPSPPKPEAFDHVAVWQKANAPQKVARPGCCHPAP